MSTKDERKSLISDPLPMDLTELSRIIPVNYSVVGPDKVLTSIVEIDEQVARVQQVLAPFVKYMQDQRDALMKRAQDEGISKDAGAVLVEIPGKQMRNKITDLDAFKLQFPQEYESIREQQEKDIDDAYKKANRDLEESEIPLTLADKKCGKDAVTEFVGYKPVTITYEVRRK